MIKLEVFRQSTKFTYTLRRMDRKIRLEVFRHLIKCTYTLRRMG